MGDEVFEKVPGRNEGNEQNNANSGKPEGSSGLPEQLVGKSPEEVYQILSQEHNRVVDDAVTNRLAELTNNRQTQNQQAQKPQTQSRTQQNVQYPQGNQVNQQAQQQQDDDNYWLDPKGFVDKQFQKRVQPLVQATVTNMRSTNREMFKDKHKEEYDKYGDEIETFIDNLNPQVQMHPDAYKVARNYVLSTHLDDVVDEKVKQRSQGKLQDRVDKLYDMGFNEEQIQNILAMEGEEQDNTPQQQNVNLFQRTVGVPPVAKPKPKPRARSESKKVNPLEKEMMEEFGMSKEEWESEKGENSDFVTEMTRRK
jgi:hypothetical protein